MSRKIFKAAEVKEIGSKVLITPPLFAPKPAEALPVEEVEEVEEVEAVEIETPPRPSIEEEKKRIIEEAEKIKEEAQSEVKKIKGEAEEAAFKIMQKSNVDVRKVQEQAAKEAEEVIRKAKEEAAQIEEEAREKAERLINEAKKGAYAQGREEGFKNGEEEVNRLIERLHVVLDTANDKRQEIIDYTEKQLIDLVLFIARKIVKVISETEKKVVVENVKEALKKVKGETEITIKINTRDADLTTAHKKAFISRVEGLKGIRIEEDSRIAPGGCVIVTSYGDIDARIQNQLGIIEEKIRELVPIKE